jgi:diguanylate cyclase (GGDEF)-like protein
MPEMPKIIAILIAFMSLRKPADFVVKPLFAGLFMCLFAFGAEVYLHGDFIVEFADLIFVTLVASLPFSGVIFLVVTYLDRLQERLAMMALTDPLTRLPNRRAFLDWTARLLARIDAADQGVLMLIDADRFKHVNDNWGHAVGDLCLQRVAERLTTELRAFDVVGRYGGEEFVVFLPGISLEVAHEVGCRLCRPIRIEPESPPGRISLTLSIGAALIRRGEPLSDALVRADTALYRAKANGRARIEIWDGGPLRPSAAA